MSARDDRPLSRRRALGALGAAAAGGAVFGTAVDALVDRGPARFHEDGTAGTIAIEPDGAEGIRSLTARSGWSDQPPMRLRFSRAEVDPDGGRHLFVMPYEFGMAIEYNGVVECWVNDWSIHNNGEGDEVEGARLWIGNHDDTGGVLITGYKVEDELHGTIAAQLFEGESGGDLRLEVREPDDGVEVRSGPTGQTRPVLRVGAASGLELFPDEPALVVTPRGDARLRGRLLAEGGLAVGNAERERQLGPVRHRVPLHDEDGRLLGYLPVHGAS